MWRKFLYSGFETRFGPSTQGAGIRYQNTSQIQILRHFDKKRGAVLKFGIGWPRLYSGSDNHDVATPIYVLLLPLVWPFPLIKGSMGAAWR